MNLSYHHFIIYHYDCLYFSFPRSPDQQLQNISFFDMILTDNDEAKLKALNEVIRYEQV